VDIYVSIEQGRANGLAIISSEPRQFTIVNIVGSIDLQKLHRLEGKFGIPKLQLQGKQVTPRVGTRPSQMRHARLVDLRPGEAALVEEILLKIVGGSLAQAAAVLLVKSRVAGPRISGRQRSDRPAQRLRAQRGRHRESPRSLPFRGPARP